MSEGQYVTGYTSSGAPVYGSREQPTATPSSAAVQPTGATMPPVDGESIRYLREIRNWMRFIGIIVIINVIAAVVIGIVVGVAVSHAVNNTTSGGTTLNSNCLSQGGTDPNC